MIDIIKKILEENQYKLLQNVDNRFYFLKNNSENKQDYYLIYNLGSYESIEMLTKKIKESENDFNDMRKHGPSVEKNTTALYILKTDQKVDASNQLWHKICEIEEIVTYMKRNVLCYIEEEELEINKIAGSLTDEIMNYLIGKENFGVFKKNGELKYEILSKIFIKMHCLKYKFDPNDFSDVDQSVRDILAVKNIHKKFVENLDLLYKNLDDAIYKRVSEDEIIDNYMEKLLKDNIEIKSIDESVDKEINRRLQRQV